MRPAMLVPQKWAWLDCARRSAPQRPAQGRCIRFGAKTAVYNRGSEAAEASNGIVAFRGAYTKTLLEKGRRTANAATTLAAGIARRSPPTTTPDAFKLDTAIRISSMTARSVQPSSSRDCPGVIDHVRGFGIGENFAVEMVGAKNHENMDLAGRTSCRVPYCGSRSIGAGRHAIWLPCPSSPVIVPMVWVPWLWSSQGSWAFSARGCWPGRGCYRR